MDVDSSFVAELDRVCRLLDDAIQHRRSCVPALQSFVLRISTVVRGKAAVEKLFERGYVTAATRLGSMLGVDAIAIGVNVIKG